MASVHEIPKYGFRLTQDVLSLAFDVHTALGPGLLESAYEECLFYELSQKFDVKRQVPIHIQYKDLIVKDAFKADLIINDELIIELKTVERILPIHEAQIIHYLHLAKKPLGLLLNFKSYRLKEGMKRYHFKDYIS